MKTTEDQMKQLESEANIGLDLSPGNEAIKNLLEDYNTLKQSNELLIDIMLAASDLEGLYCLVSEAYPEHGDFCECDKWNKLNEAFSRYREFLAEEVVRLAEEVVGIDNKA